MRKLAIAGMAVLALGAAVAPAGAQGKKQEVSGSVLGPAPYTDDSGCYAGLHRRLAIVTAEAVNGDIGYHFDIDKKTWKKPFVLEVEGGQGSPDLDIYFYAEFGTVDDVAGDPVNAGSPYTVQFNDRSPGGESGKVPEQMTKAIVCMYGGAQGAGLAADFTYVAGKGVKLPKG